MCILVRRQGSQEELERESEDLRWAFKRFVRWEQRIRKLVTEGPFHGEEEEEVDTGGDKASWGATQGVEGKGGAEDTGGQVAEGREG